jgi:hypothetical protein
VNDEGSWISTEFHCGFTKKAKKDGDATGNTGDATSASPVQPSYWEKTTQQTNTK